MKRYIFLLPMMLYGLLLAAQGTMNIYQYRLYYLFPLAEVDSVTYDITAQHPTMSVYSSLSVQPSVFSIHEIDSVTYSPGGPDLSPLVATMPPITVTTNSALVVGYCKLPGGGSAVTERGICWNTTPNPSITDNPVMNGQGAGYHSTTLNGLASGTTHYARAYAINSAGTAYGNQVQFTTLTDVPLLSTPGVGVTDLNGNTYPTIVLGNGQEWMAKDLRSVTYANGDTIPKVTNATEWGALTTGAWCNYNNVAGYDPIYGKLYNWYAASDERNVCPIGWHVPSDWDWFSLDNYLDPVMTLPGVVSGNSVGGKLKSIGTTVAGTGLWLAPNTGATDLIGFGAVPGGYRQYNGFEMLSINAAWWSANKESSDTSTAARAFGRGLINNTAMQADWHSIVRYGRSVRCLKD